MLCAHLFSLINRHVLAPYAPNLFHFLPDLGVPYVLHHAPNFYEIHPRSGFHKAVYALRLKFALCAHPFVQIYSNLASFNYTFRSTSYIFSQIWVCSMLKAMRPNFLWNPPQEKCFRILLSVRSSTCNNFLPVVSTPTNISAFCKQYHYMYWLPGASFTKLTCVLR